MWGKRTARTPQASDQAAPTVSLPLSLLGKLDRLQFILPRPTALREGTVRARSAPAAHGFEVHGYRAYSWGEDLRHLDWNAYARTGELLVRVFRAERESATYLLLDTSSSMAAPETANSNLGFGRQLVAALAYVCLRRHEPVSVALLGGEAARCDRSPLWRHRQQSLEAARFLAVARPSGRADVAAAVASFLDVALHPGIAVLVSDFFYPVEQAARALGLLRARGFAVVAVHLLRESDVDPTLSGGVVTLRDAETGEERTLHWNARTRAMYRQAIERHAQALRACCHDQGLYYVRVDPDAGLEAALLGALPQAGIVG